MKRALRPTSLQAMATQIDLSELPSHSSETAQGHGEQPEPEFPPPVHLEPEPFAAGFWDRDAHTATLRKRWVAHSTHIAPLTLSHTGYIVTLLRGTLFTALAILAVLSIYWGARCRPRLRPHSLTSREGALWKIEDYVYNLNGWVVDFDGGAMGQVVQAAAMNSTGPRNTISWSVIPASRFPGGPSDVARAVVDEECWVAIVINPGATARLNTAVSARDATYNSSSAATIYAAEARNENA